MNNPLEAEKVVVLTFDDLWATQLYAYEELMRYGYRGTFFVSNEFFKRKWPGLAPLESVGVLHRDGMEIGHHMHHNEHGCYCTIEELDEVFSSLGVARPVSFCYPMFDTKPEHFTKEQIDERFLISRLGVSHRARRSSRGAGGGPLYTIGAESNPVLCTGVFGPRYGTKGFRQDLGRISKGYAGIFCVHQIGDGDGTRRGDTTRMKLDDFDEALHVLHEEGAAVITLRELVAMREHPVLRSPYRSPVEVSTYMRKFVEGKTVCELGAACGDNLMNFLWYGGAKRVFGCEELGKRVEVCHRRGLDVKKDDFFNLQPDADVYYYWDCEHTHKRLAEHLFNRPGKFMFVVGGDPARKIEEEDVRDIVDKYGGRVELVPYNEGRGRRQHGTFHLGIVEVNNG